MRDRAFSIGLLCLFLSTFATAGGPRLVGGPSVGTRPHFGIDGKPFTWNPAQMPISYRLDPGPFSVSTSGKIVIDHNSGVQRVKNMFSVWQAVSTAKISFSNVGAILPAGSYTGGDVRTAQQYNDVIGSCNSGIQSPVIFDADGSLIASLGLPPEVIGFNVPCALDTTNGYILSSGAVLNGQFQDGFDSFSSNPPNLELSASQFDEAITHELGHFSGLDHSQINLDLLLQGTVPCEIDKLAGLPLMFPILFCQARKDSGLPILAPDDAASISTLYPNNVAATYGTISGVIYFHDGVTQAQGANVIARLIDDPFTPQDESRRIAVSVVSGYLYTGNPGQSVTASLPQRWENNTDGSLSGTRNPTRIGYYQINVPPGTYTVEVEYVYNQFIGGSSVGPLDPPITLPGWPKFWNKNESAFNSPLQRDTIIVLAGDNVTGIDIILNDAYPRFDEYEDDGELLGPLILMPDERMSA